MVEQRQSAMQRIQVGLVGLVVVLLFVSLATMVLERVTDSPASSESSGRSALNVDGTAKIVAPDEPLAELGVTPVAKEEAKVDGIAPTTSDNVRRTPTAAQR